MTIMTSDHTKTKIDVFHKTNGQANCGMGEAFVPGAESFPDLYDILLRLSDGKILDTVGFYLQ